MFTAGLRQRDMAQRGTPWKRMLLRRVFIFSTKWQRLFYSTVLSTDARCHVVPILSKISHCQWYTHTASKKLTLRHRRILWAFTRCGAATIAHTALRRTISRWQRRAIVNGRALTSSVPAYPISTSMIETTRMASNVPTCRARIWKRTSLWVHVSIVHPIYICIWIVYNCTSAPQTFLSICTAYEFFLSLSLVLSIAWS